MRRRRKVVPNIRVISIIFPLQFENIGGCSVFSIIQLVAQNQALALFNIGNRSIGGGSGRIGINIGSAVILMNKRTLGNRILNMNDSVG